MRRRRSPESPCNFLMSPSPVSAKRWRVARMRIAALRSMRRISARAGTVKMTFFMPVPSGLEVFGGEAELSEDVLMRNAFAGMLCHPSLCGSYGPTLSFALRFVVDGGVGDGAGDGIKHGLQQTDHGGQLTGGHAVDQFVRFFLGLSVSHCENPDYYTAPLR